MLLLSTISVGHHATNRGCSIPHCLKLAPFSCTSKFSLIQRVYSKYCCAIIGNMPSSKACATMRRITALNLPRWIEENRHLLKPPVGNKLIFQDEFKVMLVAGPNSRTDYHVEPGEEWFYQLEGNMTLKVVTDGQFYDIHMSAGDTLCLPSGVPHSPQREANSLGIVIERERKPGEFDYLRWYCQKPDCRNKLYEERFFCQDLTRDLSPIIERYFTDEILRTCGKCGFVEPPRPAM